MFMSMHGGRRGDHISLFTLLTFRLFHLLEEPVLPGSWRASLGWEEALLRGFSSISACKFKSAGEGPIWSIVHYTNTLGLRVLQCITITQRGKYTSLERAAISCQSNVKSNPMYSDFHKGLPCSDANNNCMHKLFHIIILTTYSTHHAMRVQSIIYSLHV